MDSEWTDLEPAPAAASTKAPVRFGLQKIRGTKARGVILLSRDVLHKLELTNWRVRVRIGSGAHAHQIAILGDTDGPFELQEMGVAKGGGVFRVRLPVVERFPDATAANVEVAWKVERQGKASVLVIDLPPYCWDQTSARKFEQRYASEAG